MNSMVRAISNCRPYQRVSCSKKTSVSLSQIIWPCTHYQAREILCDKTRWILKKFLPLTVTAVWTESRRHVKMNQNRCLNQNQCLNQSQCLNLSALTSQPQLPSHTMRTLAAERQLSAKLFASKVRKRFRVPNQQRASDLLMINNAAILDNSSKMKVFWQLALMTQVQCKTVRMSWKFPTVLMEYAPNRLRLSRSAP